MIELQSYLSSLQIRTLSHATQIWDPVRNKWFVLTPEETVRQCIILFLHRERAYPTKRMSVEKTINYNKLVKRYDLVVYSKSAHPYILIECKAPSVKIGQNDIDQISLYNQKLQVPFLWLTNGLDHYIYQLDLSVQRINRIDDIPFCLEK